MKDEMEKRFKQMMHAARLARGLDHPENDTTDDVKFPGENAIQEMERRIKEVYGDGVEFNVRKFDLSDPDQVSEVEDIFKAYYDNETPEGDLDEFPGDESAFDELMAEVLSDWNEAPEPEVGESFEDYMVRIGVAEAITPVELTPQGFLPSRDELAEQAGQPGAFDNVSDEVMANFYRSLGIGDDEDSTPEVAGEGGVYDGLEWADPAPTIHTPEQRTEHSQGIRRGILEEAESLINGPRNSSYGDPIDDFQRTADMWTTYLSGVAQRQGGQIVLDPHDVAIMMMLLKVSRLSWTPDSRDNWVDIAGYTACGADCADHEHGGLI